VVGRPMKMPTHRVFVSPRAEGGDLGSSWRDLGSQAGTWLLPRSGSRCASCKTAQVAMLAMFVFREFRPCMLLVDRGARLSLLLGLLAPIFGLGALQQSSSAETPKPNFLAVAAGIDFAQLIVTLFDISVLWDLGSVAESYDNIFGAPTVILILLVFGEVTALLSTPCVYLSLKRRTLKLRSQPAPKLPPDPHGHRRQRKSRSREHRGSDVGSEASTDEGPARSSSKKATPDSSRATPEPQPPPEPSQDVPRRNARRGRPRSQSEPEPEAPEAKKPPPPLDLGTAGLEEVDSAWVGGLVRQLRSELVAIPSLAKRKARVRELQRQYHPDKNPGNEKRNTCIFLYIQMWWDDLGGFFHEEFQRHVQDLKTGAV